MLKRFNVITPDEVLQALEAAPLAWSKLSKRTNEVKEKYNKMQNDEADEIKILSKLVKQRKESADISISQKRSDLAKTETDQAEIIKKFLPKQLNEEEIESVVIEIIKKTNASGMQDMGKVMGMVTKQLSGKSDGKTISQIVRKNLI